jgi:hypothetical protein
MLGKSREHSQRGKPVLWGITAGTTLLSIYIGVLTIANSFSHALQQFQEMWYWIVLLVIGFGIQVGMYAYIKGVFKLRADTGAATSSVAAAGGISTTSMIACCAHHLTDIIPILGLSATAVFLSRFQMLFLVVGVLSNLIGINLMLNIIQQHNLYTRGRGLLSVLMKVNMKKTLYTTSIISGFIFLITLLTSM